MRPCSSLSLVILKSKLSQSVSFARTSRVSSLVRRLCSEVALARAQQQYDACPLVRKRRALPSGEMQFWIFPARSNWRWQHKSKCALFRSPRCISLSFQPSSNSPFGATVTSQAGWIRECSTIIASLSKLTPNFVRSSIGLLCLWLFIPLQIPPRSRGLQSA